MIVLPAIWLLVVGYGLLYVGYMNQSGKPTSFQDAFFGAKAKADTSGAITPIQAKGSSSGFSGPNAVAGGAGGGGGGGSW